MVYNTNINKKQTFKTHWRCMKMEKTIKSIETIGFYYEQPTTEIKGGQWFIFPTQFSYTRSFQPLSEIFSDEGGIS